MCHDFCARFITKASKDADLIELVQIQGIGAYTLKTIETFRRIEVLKEATDLRLNLHKWLLEKALPSMPAEYHAFVEETAAKVFATFPFEPLPGLPNRPESVVAIVYKAIPPAWLDDAAIRAVCYRMQNDFPSCRYTGNQSAVPVSLNRRSRSRIRQVADPEVLARVIEFAASEEVDTTMIPVNFDNIHWCGIVVRKKTKSILFYDPLNQDSHKIASEEIATSLVRQGLRDYKIVSLNNPIQFDAHSCGVFVAWMFLRLWIPACSSNMSEHLLPQRRFELFYYILTGRFIPTNPLIATILNDVDDGEILPPTHRNRTRTTSFSLLVIHVALRYQLPLCLLAFLRLHNSS